PALAAAAAVALNLAEELSRLVANALHATVPRMASPIEPPTCWPVLSRLEATPVSSSRTLLSASSDSGTNIRPNPNAATIIGPSRPPAYELVSLTWDSQNRPPAPNTEPTSSSGRAPIRATSCEADHCIATAANGRA